MDSATSVTKAAARMAATAIARRFKPMAAVKMRFSDVDWAGVILPGGRSAANWRLSVSLSWPPRVAGLPKCLPQINKFGLAGANQAASAGRVARRFGQAMLGHLGDQLADHGLAERVEVFRD